MVLSRFLRRIAIEFGTDPPRSLKPRAEDRMPAVQETVDRVRRIDVDQYRYGFETLIESDKAPKGLSEDTVRFISAKKNEPTWARVDYPKIDYQDLYYYAAPKPKKQVGSLDEIDPEILKTYEKLGIPLREVGGLEGVVKAQ